MEDILADIEHLLNVYNKDGQDGYSAFSIDPNERSNVEEMCEAIERLKGYVNV